MSKTRKIASDFFDSGKDDLSTELGREATFDEAGAILVPDEVESLPKGRYGSGKIRKEFSGLKDQQDWSSAKAQRKLSKAKGKHKAIAKVGDWICVPAELFDSTPGSYSKDHPERCFGTVSSINKKGIAKIIWVEDGRVMTAS